MCTTTKSSFVRISPEYQFVLCVCSGWETEDGEQCAPDLYSDLKAVVDNGTVTSCC